MAGLVKAPLVTDTMPPTGARDAGWLAGLRMGTEFRNITFPGERAAATRALLAYEVYEKYDRKLRAMAKTNLAQAIAFDIGTSSVPSFSSWSYLPCAQPHSSRGPTAVGWRSSPTEVSSAGST